MSKKGKEIRSKIFGLNPIFNYLPAGDRYLLSVDKPKYRFNVIGTGINGREHVRVTMLEGRAAIHGVYDPNPLSVASAQQEFANFAPQDVLTIYDSLEAACHDPAVDGLIICTPNYTHIEVVREAVKSGKHILLEKPMATTLPDAYEISRLAAQYEAVFQIGLQYRFKSIYIEAIHEALERKSIGEIKTISILEHRAPFLDKVGQWNKFSKYSGGTLVEKCCHYFDLMNLFAQSKPVSVYATGSMAVNFLEFEYENEKSDIIDNALVIVRYENGIQASFNLCMFSPAYYEELILCGDEGRLKAFENEDFLPETGPKTRLEILCGERRPSRISTPTYPTHIDQSGHNGSTFYEHVNFINNIDGLETNTAKAIEGFWSVVIGVAAEKSVQTGQLVNIADLLAEHGIGL
ncbi:MAG: Gfo/Idh/MocA family oxidoreductase [Anaerolineae bacterium]|nr:Gfo/Idh/MocA family oxidoreductase [Anaerolineae bacterium]